MEGRGKEDQREKKRQRRGREGGRGKKEKKGRKGREGKQIESKSITPYICCMGKVLELQLDMSSSELGISKNPYRTG